MANGFSVLAQRRTPAIRADGSVQDTVEVTARAMPSGVIFTRVIPYQRWAQQGLEAALGPIAEHIAQIMRDYPVVGAGTSQTVSPGGLIANEVEFTVTTEAERGQASPAHTTTVSVPVQALYSRSEFGEYFNPIIAALAAAAEL